MFKSFNWVRGRDFPPLKLRSAVCYHNHVSTAVVHGQGAFACFLFFVFLHQKFNTSGFKNLWHQFSACATCHSFRPSPTYCGLFLLWDLLKLPENGCSSIQAVCHCVAQHKQAFIHTKKCVSVGKRHRASGKRGCRVLTRHINKVGRRLITRASICQTGRQAVRLFSPPWTLRLPWFSPAAGHEYWPMHPRLKHNICFSAG